jgi:hypothetical protein
MLLIGYSNRATIIWPNVDYDYGDSHTESIGGVSYGIGTGVDTIVGPISRLHYYKPSRNFKRGLDSAGSGSTDLNIETAIDNTGFEAYTCASEGLRLGAEMLHKWLENDVDASIRDQLQINFIFFTDGEFNTIRSYVRGPGFGTNKTNRGNVDTPSRLSVHNTFHDYDPIIAKNLNTTFEGKNLSTLFGSYADPTDVPGINACFNMNDVSTSYNEWMFMPGNGNSSASDESSVWKEQLYFPFRSVAHRDSINDIPQPHRMSGGDDGQWQGCGFLLGENMQGSYTDYYAFTENTSNISSNNTTLSPAMIEAEKDRNRYLEYIHFPVSVTNEWINPADGERFMRYDMGNGNFTQKAGTTAGQLTRNGSTYYYLPDATYDYYGDNSSQRMSDALFGYDPHGRLWSNHYGSYYRWYRGSATSYHVKKSELPYIYEKSSGSRRTGWVVGTARLADFYLDYTMAGQPHFHGDGVDSIPDSWSSTYKDRDLRRFGDPDYSEMDSPPLSDYRGSGYLSDSEDNFIENDQDHRPRVRRWWRFSSGSWTTSSGVIDDEAYWMSRAQAFVLKDQYNASFYTVVYGNNGNATEMKKIANDPAYPGQYNSTLPDGKFYKTGESSQELTDVFRDIASRIAVKLTD